MGKKSGINYARASWSPWYGGCDGYKIFTECEHCYARAQMRRFGKDPDKLTRGKTTFQKPLFWAKDPAIKHVFVCPWSDFFLPAADPWRPEAWEIMRETPGLTYIIPTKKPELILERLPEGWGAGWPNVWLLVSAGTRATLKMHWGAMQDVPAKVKGLSLAPLLEHLLFSGFLRDWRVQPDWVVIEGESGSEARMCINTWMLDVVWGCRKANIPVWVKQLGTHHAKETSVKVSERHQPLEAKSVYQLGDRAASDMQYWPEDLRIRQLPGHYELSKEH